jgi:hypothetical protein
MKNIVLIISFVLLSVSLQAQKFQKIDKSVVDIAYYPAKAPIRVFEKKATKRAALEPKIRVTYSRPLKKERTIFGKLLKFNEPWRIGANESTEVLFMTDVTFGDSLVKAGRYSLIIIPTETEWTLKLNTDLDGWGDYSYDPSKDIASITAPTKESKKEIEALSIALYENSENIIHLKVGWDKTIAEFPIRINE